MIRNDKEIIEILEKRLKKSEFTIDKIKAEIETWHKEGTNWSDIRLMNIEDIIKRYKAESEGKGMKTYEDIYNEFCNKFPNVEVEDYRPADPMYIPQLLRGIPYAILVWLKDGSKVVYMSESEG